MNNQQLNSRTTKAAKHSDLGGRNTAGKIDADFRAGQSTRSWGRRGGSSGYALNTLSITWLALAVGLLLIPGVARAQQYVFENISVPNDTFTQLLGINDADVIAGYHNQNVNQGFTLNLPNSFTPENFPTGVQGTQVIGINNLGNTGGFYQDSSGIQHGFLRTNGVFSTVDFPGTNPINQILGVNNTGQAAGYFQATSGAQTPFIFNPGLPPGGQFSIGGSLPVSGQATGINDLGQVTGFFPTSTGDDGFLLSAGKLQTLSFPGATVTQALGLNNLGQVVGFYNDASGNSHGFLFSNNAFTSLNDPGATMTTINGINNFGHIVGFALEPNGNTVGFVGAPLVVPEPSLFSLLALGSTALVGMCILRSRRYLR
jgi:probable HAF family extracellular repeat protein